MATMDHHANALATLHALTDAYQHLPDVIDAATIPGQTRRAAPQTARAIARQGTQYAVELAERRASTRITPAGAHPMPIRPALLDAQADDGRAYTWRECPVCEDAATGFMEASPSDWWVDGYGTDTIDEWARDNPDDERAVAYLARRSGGSTPDTGSTTLSAEILEIMYLRCDYVWTNWSGERCTVHYPTVRESGYPPNGEALEVLARKASESGWRVEVRSEGLKGWSASSLCPDHAATPDTTGGQRP